MTFLGKQVYPIFCKKLEHVSLPLSDTDIFIIPHNIHLRLINRTSKLFFEKLSITSRYSIKTLKSSVYRVGTLQTLPTFHQIEVSFINKTFLMICSTSKMMTSLISIHCSIFYFKIHHLHQFIVDYLCGLSIS